MALSLLRNPVKNCFPLLNRGCLRIKLVTKDSKNVFLIQQVREMGARKMIVKPSRYDWTRVKDVLHFYVMLNLIPMGLLITYVNMTQGRCELAEIPEGYEPKYWEYYKHPITQALSRNFFRDPEREYEHFVYTVHIENQKRLLRLRQRKAEELMVTKGDGRGWYFQDLRTETPYKEFDIEKEKVPV